MTPTPTPRTDERANNWESTDGQWVSAEFARWLERELAECREWSSKLADVADDLRAELATERDQLAANHEATKLMGKWLEDEQALADEMAAQLDHAQYTHDPGGCKKAIAAWKKARNERP